MTMRVADFKSLLSRATYSPIGLDPGSRCVKAVQLVRHGQEPWRIAAAAVVENRADEPAACAASLRRLGDVLERQGFVGRRVVVAAPAEKLEGDVLELPPRSAGVPVEQIAQSELTRLSRLEEGAFEMAAWDLPAPERASAGTATHLMAVALRHADAERLLDPLAAEGFDATALDVQAWALARAAGLQPQSGTHGITAVLDMGHTAALLVLLHHGSVVYQRRLAEAGTGALRRALCGRFNVGERIAGLLLEGTDGSSHSTPADPELAVGLRALVAKYLEGIVPDVEASFGYASHRYAAEVQRLLVVGAGARLPDVIGFLGRRLGIACQALSPAELMPCTPQLEEKCRNPLLTAALGLALHGTAGQLSAGGVNLVPAYRAARARRGRRRRAWIAACSAYTLALAGVCGVADLAAGHDLPALRAELERVSGESADWTNRHAQTRAALAQASSRLRAARAVTDHPHWHLLLKALAPALGEDVVLRGARIDTSDTAQSGAPVVLTSGSAAKPARTYTVELRGFARSQPAVTQLPLKLEAMKLFDEVKLVRAQREPFLSADAVAFHVRCTLTEEVAP